MQDLSRLLDTIEKWVDSGIVGNLVIYHPPKVSRFGAYTEQTVKLHEMTDELAAAFERIIELTGALKGEFYTNDEGKPDRIKIVKAV